ncbi:gluconeogenesis factor YvcK family protein [Nocardioides terrisoli]|uniref:gluconeogenesis factor YvcK family protein n=1 Tax=Nocardioides terrisoli TaxID=3388267 RepID=UPI00287B669E|nr:uridine diphosphate-N-acetylglucosamine-binding protein YvcK [Nocardioides marmorisolisilvae]
MTGALVGAGEPRIVALGGGHGLAASLEALRRVTTELTAVVTVADNGGSSGRLRSEFGVLPPGDLRMALAALCGDDRWGQTWARVLQHRFASDGDLDGHAMGNLLIVSLWELLGDHVLGLDWVAGLLGARGRVLPMSTVPLDIVAEARGLDADSPERTTWVRGQVQVATTPGLVAVELDPPAPPACPEAVRAVQEADHVVLGPGSWFTSVIPHLLVPDLRTALCRTSASVIVTMNLVAQTGETEGLDPVDHLEALRRHAPDLRIDHVLANPAGLTRADELDRLARECGGVLDLVDVRDEALPGRHNPEKLAHAYASLVSAT